MAAARVHQRKHELPALLAPTGPDNADFQSTNLGTNRDFVSIPPLDVEDLDKGEGLESVGGPGSMAC